VRPFPAALPLSVRARSLSIRPTPNADLANKKHDGILD